MLKRFSKLASDMAKVQYEEYDNYRRNNYRLHLDNDNIILRIDVIT